MKPQAGKKSLEAPKGPYLLTLRKQANVFPFHLENRPVAYNLRFFPLVTLSCDPMHKGVDRYPNCLDRGKMFFSLLSRGMVQHLYRLPDRADWHGLRPHEQVEPVQEGHALSLAMDKHHRQQGDQRADDDAGDNMQRSSERKTACEYPKIRQELREAHAENFLLKFEEMTWYPLRERVSIKWMEMRIFLHGSIYLSPRGRYQRISSSLPMYRSEQSSR